MKNEKYKSQSINLFNNVKFKETLLNFVNPIKPEINEEFEIYIKDLVKDLKKQEKEKSKEKDKNKEEEKKIIVKKINFNIVQYILKKRKRTKDELLVLKYFLSEMDFLSLIKADIAKDKLLFSLSKFLKLEKKPQNSIIFRYGNKGNKFYIVFSGELSVLILKETKVQISYLRYFMHLIILKLLKEDDLLYKIISSNFGSNKVNKDEFDFYFENINKFVNKYFGKFSNKNRYFIFKENICSNKLLNNKLTVSQNISYTDILNDLDIILDSDCSSGEEENEEEEDEENQKESEFNDEEYERNKSKSIKKAKRKEIFKKNPIMLKIYNINKNLNYEEILINQMEIKKLKFIVIYFIFCREFILSKKQFSSIHEYINYTYLNSPMHLSIDFDNIYKEKEIFNLYYYFEITKKSKGDTFGELALQHSDNKRTGTIYAVSDTVLGYLSKADYDLSISTIELKKRKKDVNFIMSFSIFRQMNWYVFENRYFNFFKKETIIKGEKIMAQGQKNSKLFFIVDGQFEVTTSMSLKKLYSFLRLKMGKNFDLVQGPLKGNNKIYTFRICIGYNKDLLGLKDCYFYNDISFIDATCISIKSTVFSVDISILNELREKNPEIGIDLKKFMDKKKEIMIERLKNIYYKTLKFMKYFQIRKNISYSSDKNKIKLKLNRKNDFKHINNSNILKDDKKEVIVESSNNKIHIHPKLNTNLNLNLIKFISKKKKNLYTNNTQNIDSNTEDTIKKIENLNTSIEFNNEIIKEHNKTFFKNRKSDYSELYTLSKNSESNKKKEFIICEKKENKKFDNINHIMKIRSLSTSKNNKFILKTSKELGKISDIHSSKKLFELYSPINTIIKKEYSNLFNWIEDNYNTKNSSRKKIKYNTEEKYFENEKLNKANNRKTNNLFKMRFSSKKTTPKKINIKKVLKLNKGIKDKLSEETNNNINDSFNKEKIKNKALSFNTKRHIKNNKFIIKKNGFKNSLEHRENRLKRLFSRFLKNTSCFVNKSNKKIENINKKKDLKCNIISNIEQYSNLSDLMNKKINFFLCSENTKKEYGFGSSKLYINNYASPYYYQNIHYKNEF